MSGHRIFDDLFKGQLAGANLIDDPGVDNGVFNLSDKSHATCLVETAASEARLLPNPLNHPVGAELKVILDVDGGNLTVSVETSDAINAAGESECVFDAAGDWALYAVHSLGGLKRWRIIASDGVTFA